MEKQFETISIQFRKEDKDKLMKKAEANRLKLSSYLRHQLTKDLKDG
ncbi:MAG: hypothetical protein ACON4B_02370 [Flavobacteriaceae bacterium]